MKYLIFLFAIFLVTNLFSQCEECDSLLKDQINRNNNCYEELKANQQRCDSINQKITKLEEANTSLSKDTIELNQELRYLNLTDSIAA